MIPHPDQSVQFDTTNNLIIEGDNLEVLKLLQKSYLGKVKVIYIDPPYNTGTDFIYPDNYTESLQTYLEYTGQADAEGKKYSTNSDTDGRFHSKWLNMMYPRLYLARNLLRRDGVMLVSIDDGELSNLVRLLDDVFGEDNRLAILIWNKQHSQQQGIFKRYHEYVVVCARDKAGLAPISGGEGEIEAGALKKISRSNPASDFAFPAGVRFDAPDGTKLTGTFGDAEKVTVVEGVLEARDGATTQPVTLFAGWTQRDQMTRYFAGEEVLDSRGQRVVEFFFSSSGKLKCRKDRSRITPPTLLPPYGMVSEQTAYIEKLIGKAVFDNPKPVGMIADFLAWFADEEDTVLDFFAGSYTTCDAVLRANRRLHFIAVQLPEPVDPTTEAGKNAASLGLSRITDIGRERVLRVIDDLNSPTADLLSPGEQETRDLGFRVFSLAESNFLTWDAEESKDAARLADQLAMHVDHVREGRTDWDLLYEILLKSGFPLATTVEAIELAGKTVFSVADGALLLCLDRGLTLELVREIAAKAPERVVLLDEGFVGNDQLKTNAVQIFKTKGITSFKTV